MKTRYTGSPRKNTFLKFQDLDSFVQQTVQKLKFQKGTFPWTLGLGEICAEDPNFKIKTWALGF